MITEGEDKKEKSFFRFTSLMALKTSLHSYMINSKALDCHGCSHTTKKGGSCQKQQEMFPFSSWEWVHCLGRVLHPWSNMAFPCVQMPMGVPFKQGLQEREFKNELEDGSLVQFPAAPAYNWPCKVLSTGPRTALKLGVSFQVHDIQFLRTKSWIIRLLCICASSIILLPSPCPSCLC